LAKVVSSPPKITPKSTTSRLYRVYFTMKKASRRHPYFTFGILLGLLLSLSLWTRGRARKGKGPGGIIDGSGTGLGMFKLDRKDSLLGSVGLGGQNGKVD
jgi:protein disulfide-isomerase